MVQLSRLFLTRLSYAALACAGLAACAGLDTRLPEIAQAELAEEAKAQETEALTNFEVDNGKLLDIGWPILTANAALCPRTRPSIGVKTLSLGAYPKRFRDGAERIFGATDEPRIYHIAKGGPAARAGLQRGDIILNDEGDPAKLSGDTWDASLADKSIDIRRGTEVMSISITPVTACSYNLQLDQSTAINAYANGRSIIITTGMVDFVESDDELALIIGHELAHNTMGHIPKSILNFILSFGGTRYTRPFESEADYVGLYYMARAGYSPKGVEDFWQRLSALAPRSIHLAKTHPTFPERYLRIQAAQAEILSKQQTGAPLLPNFKIGDDTSQN